MGAPTRSPQGSIGSPSVRPSVLVVDDDPATREIVNRLLTREGLHVREAADGRRAGELISAQPPDLVILDVVMPPPDGFDVLSDLRRNHHMPVIMLTGRDELTDRVLGLELGADDYLVKPFEPRELVARVRAALRRTRLETTRQVTRMDFDGLSVDTLTRGVLVAGAPVELTAREFDLLAFLAASPRQVFSRAQIVEQVWESSPEWRDTAIVTEYVRRLRSKIEVEPSRPRWILTVRGVGYRLEP